MCVCVCVGGGGGSFFFQVIKPLSCLAVAKIDSDVGVDVVLLILKTCNDFRETCDYKQ